MMTGVVTSIIIVLIVQIRHRKDFSKLREIKVLFLLREV